MCRCVSDDYGNCCRVFCLLRKQNEIEMLPRLPNDLTDNLLINGFDEALAFGGRYGQVKQVSPCDSGVFLLHSAIIYIEVKWKSLTIWCLALWVPFTLRIIYVVCMRIKCVCACVCTVLRKIWCGRQHRQHRQHWQHRHGCEARVDIQGFADICFW